MFQAPDTLTDQLPQPGVILTITKRGGVLFLAADYGGIAMESIPVINGTHSCDERRTFPVGGRLNDLRLKCCIDRQNEKNNITGSLP